MEVFNIKFRVIGKNDCFYYLKDSMGGIYKISKYHFHSFDAGNEGEYLLDLGDYVETYYELLISDNVLCELEDSEYSLSSMETL